MLALVCCSTWTLLACIWCIAVLCTPGLGGAFFGMFWAWGLLVWAVPWHIQFPTRWYEFQEVHKLTASSLEGSFVAFQCGWILVLRIVWELLQEAQQGLFACVLCTPGLGFTFTGMLWTLGVACLCVVMRHLQSPYALVWISEVPRNGSELTFLSLS